MHLPVDYAEHQLQVLCDPRSPALMHLGDDARAAQRAADESSLVPHVLVRLRSEDRLAVAESNAHPRADRIRVFTREGEDVGQESFDALVYRVSPLGQTPRSLHIPRLGYISGFAGMPAPGPRKALAFSSTDQGGGKRRLRYCLAHSESGAHHDSGTMPAMLLVCIQVAGENARSYILTRCCAFSVKKADKRQIVDIS